MTRPVAAVGGQVAGHVGDAIVLFIPIPNGADERASCAAAIEAALAGLDNLHRLGTGRSGQVTAPLRARIGIDVGDIVHGNVGSKGRFSFSIIGTPVNRAARLQDLAKQLGAVMLLPYDLAERAAMPFQSFGTYTLKGFDRAIELVGAHHAG